MSDLYTIGASGLRAYQNAIASVGQNVANANSEGYTRRVMRFTESPVSYGTSIIYAPKTIFGGVSSGSVVRMVDQFKTYNARQALSENGQAQTKLQWHGAIEEKLTDSAQGIGQRLSAMFGAADTLAAQPDGTLPRITFLNSVSDVADAFSQTAADLTKTRDDLQTQAGIEVDQANQEIVQLGQINLQIRRAADGTAAKAQIEDERDRLIDSLSSKIGVTANLDDTGVVTLTLSNDKNVTLLQGTTPSLIGIDIADDGRFSLLTTQDGALAGITAGAGSLSALVEVSGSLADRRQELNVLAADFVTDMNDWHAQGLDQNGDAGGPLLSGTDANSMKLLISDPKLLAVADTTGVENGNILALRAMRTADDSFENRWSAAVSSQAVIVAAATSKAQLTAATESNALATRDGVSGVDLDQEAADLLRYQQAYQASAKVIQIAKDMLDTLMNSF